MTRRSTLGWIVTASFLTGCTYSARLRTAYTDPLQRIGDPKPWDVLFIYRYRDLESFGRRDEVSASVRGPLRLDAEWQRWSDIKSTVRMESENTSAERLAGE